ncbi:minor capsid protein [Halalkalibacterium ligniniphilum]|uniref:minor capsid protein n=1 Tax=Halalkalibacterium ligniniphilum TaxID=1134413 RepID=UPI000368D515|nr:minor capsid protein [Halalkalibacterium ligniniphilum]
MTRQRVRVTIDTKNIAPKLKKASERARFLVSQQVLKDSNRFVPFDTGNLRDSSIRASNFDEGQIAWDTPYARKLYFGVRMNFSRDSNPSAGPLWYERARAAHLQGWINVAKQAVNNQL